MFHHRLDEVDIDYLDDVVGGRHKSGRNSAYASRSHFEDSRLHRAGTVGKKDIITIDSGNSSLACDHLTTGAGHGCWVYNISEAHGGGVNVIDG